MAGTWWQAAALAVAMVAAGPVAAETVAPVYEITLAGDIEIGPEGKVVRHELDDGQPPAIEAALARNIERWRFEPVTVDGRPVIAVTRMKVSLSALPMDNGDYQLRLDNVWFGEPVRNSGNRKPPRYPEEALMAGLGAKVVLVLKIDPDGSVSRIHTEQASLSHRIRNEHRAEQWRERFTRNAARVAKDWTFDIVELVDGRPVGTSVRVPVVYEIEGEGRNGWNAFVPGPHHPVPWVTDRSVAAAGELQEGDVQPLESRFRLRSDITGTML